MSKHVVLSMKKTKAALKSFMHDMPDKDCYATVYTLVFDLATALTKGIKEIPASLKEAKKDIATNNGGKNHAKEFLRSRKAKKNESE